MIMIHFADVVFCKILTQISFDFRNHQSSNWFNNFVILPPISNDLDKNTQHKITIHKVVVLMILASYTSWTTNRQYKVQTQNVGNTKQTINTKHHLWWNLGSVWESGPTFGCEDHYHVLDLQEESQLYSTGMSSSKGITGMQDNKYTSTDSFMT